MHPITPFLTEYLFQTLQSIRHVNKRKFNFLNTNLIFHISFFVNSIISHINYDSTLSSKIKFWSVWRQKRIKTLVWRRYILIILTLHTLKIQIYHHRQHSVGNCQSHSLIKGKPLISNLHQPHLLRRLSHR